MASQPHVVVIGAGVIGLTNAVFLAEAGYKVTTIASHVPGTPPYSPEYTSPWAGAHWRTHATVDEPEQCDWDVQTLRFWRDEMSEGERREAGVGLRDSLHFWDGHVEEELWWARHVAGFGQLSGLGEPMRSVSRASEAAGGPRVQWGAESKAFSVDAPRYLVYLQERARRAGAVVFQSGLPTDGGFGKALETAEGISRAISRGEVDCFVNCTGLGAIKLCGDEKMFPVRGQTVLVKGEAAATRTRYHSGAIGTGSTSYCIPRPGSGTTILGGTKEKGNWSSEPNPETTKDILRKCAWMVPELLTGKHGGFEAISSQCGLRPGREGGPRTEKEIVAGRKVVHAYGNAGGGYQNSIGVARKVLKLVDESVGRQNKGVVSSKL